MNTFLNGLKDVNNFGYTENGAVTHRTSKSALLDMFALGGAYRNRSDEDCILLFKNAFEENPTYALKCLFYLRDVRGGQGERRFFRVCIKWAANNATEAIRRNLIYIPFYGRYDDLYVFVGTKLESDAMKIIKDQLSLDVQCETPSLLAKWLKSENTSSKESKRLGGITREYLGMDHKQYRKTLSILRARINVLERLMSENKWDQIVFDRIPSKAGMKYKNAFARHDIERAKAGVQTYADFAKDETKSVNAAVLNPVDIANQIFNRTWGEGATQTERLMWQKYWDNLEDYYNGAKVSDLAIVDVSGSMTGQPMNAAVSMGAYMAERCKGPFKDHFITFSSNPQLVKFEGVDVYDKFIRARGADWGGSTNIEAVFNMMLDVALRNGVSVEDMPQTLYIFSDMEFNGCISRGPISTSRWGMGEPVRGIGEIETLLEGIAKKWAVYGYKLPRVIFWNLDARQNNIPALGGRFSYVSGFSMNMVKTILSGKDGYDLMKEKLNEPRYSVIH